MTIARPYPVSFSSLRPASSSVSGFLAERKPYLLRPILRMLIETRSRDAGDTNFLHEMPGKVHVALESKPANVRHYVISAPRPVTFESRPLQRRYQMIAPRPVTLRQFLIVRGRQTQSRRARFLQRRRCPTVKKSCTLRIAFVIAGGATAHPTRQPVTL